VGARSASGGASASPGRVLIGAEAEVVRVVRLGACRRRQRGVLLLAHVILLKVQQRVAIYIIDSRQPDIMVAGATYGPHATPFLSTAPEVKVKPALHLCRVIMPYASLPPKGRSIITFIRGVTARRRACTSGSSQRRADGGLQEV